MFWNLYYDKGSKYHGTILHVADQDIFWYRLQEACYLFPEESLE